MNKEKLKAVLFKPEDKPWIRVLDAVAVSLGAFGICVLFFILPLSIESTLLKFSFYGAILSIPILAYTLYRKTNLSKIERIAILLLVLSTAFALMVATL